MRRLSPAHITLAQDYICTYVHTYVDIVRRGKCRDYIIIYIWGHCEDRYYIHTYGDIVRRGI